MTKNNKNFAQDAKTVIFGRPPLENSILQQMFYKCISNNSAASVKTSQDETSKSNHQHIATKTKG